MNKKEFKIIANKIFANDKNLYGQEYMEYITYFSEFLPDSFSRAELLASIENEYKILYKNHGRRKGMLTEKDTTLYIYFLSVLHAESEGGA